MNGEERRKEIVEAFRFADSPVSGGNLADMFAVSRQIIVQDIALLRAQGYDIISTNRGYLLKTSDRVSRVYHVHHTDEQIGEELNLMVDLGGCIRDVFVIHEIYGTIRADMKISSRRQVSIFLSQLENGQATPLMNITKDSHYHTVEADSLEILDDIEKELDKKGFLLDIKK